MNPFDLVKEFVVKFKRPIGRSQKNMDLGWNLIHEEYHEVLEEIQNRSMDEVNMMDLTEELADLQYVINYMAVVNNLPLMEVFEEKHRANMSKVGNDGNPVLREDGKILKGPNYQPPNYERFFQ
tara:strand:+ start:6033 stop:6404 length:372 start_codon:yes stop_codon:yes gene_type:complete